MKPRRIEPGLYLLDVGNDTWRIWHGGRWNARRIGDDNPANTLFTDTLDHIVRQCVHATSLGVSS